jgi:DNA polymerase-3 subunit delta'
MRQDGGVSGLYEDVPGQERAVAALRHAAERPVHAYLLVGAAGTGVEAAATSFAASLLCPAGGDGSCDVCRRVLAGVHPDVVRVERDGPAITIDTARSVTRLAARSPVEGGRKVLILEDFHLVKEAGPALLKTVEEPPASVVFVILAEFVPPELVTVASRCVRVDFAAIRPDDIAELLVAEGVDERRALELARASGGRLDRARLLAADPGFEQRRAAWMEIPGRLDGTGAAAAQAADDLIGLLDRSVEPIRARHEAELGELEERNTRAAEVKGKVGRAARSTLKSGLKELEERQRRELRRQRTDELRAGLAALAGVYRDRLAAAAVAGDDPTGVRSARDALDLIQELSVNLVHNPGEQLALQSLFSQLGRLPAGPRPSAIAGREAATR